MAGVLLTGAGSPHHVRGSSSRPWILTHAVWSNAGAWADAQAWRDWLLGGGAWDDHGIWADTLTWQDS